MMDKNKADQSASPKKTSRLNDTSTEAQRDRQAAAYFVVAEVESWLKVMHGQSCEGATLAPTCALLYRDPVAANSATGFDGPIKLAHKRPSNPKAGAFFTPVSSSYGGCVREGFGPAGCQLSRSVNLRTAATLNRLTAIDGSSKPKVGAIPMKKIRTIRAAAHRRMAIAALHADTSLKTRLTRYQQHMTKARALESVGGVQ